MIEEDRDDDELFDLEDGNVSLSYTKTHALQGLDKEDYKVDDPAVDENPITEEENDRMWDYVIERHGRKEFELVYSILKKHGDARFDERG